MAKRSIALVTVALLVLAACDDAPESGRTIVSIQEFNNGGPVQSDVLFQDDTNTYITEDVISAVFVARPYNNLVTGTAHSSVVIDNYQIVWTRTDGGTGVLPTRNEAASILVAVGDETEAFIRLVTFGDKETPLLSGLVGGGQISMRADITFSGREVGTEEEFELTASVTATFANLANE